MTTPQQPEQQAWQIFVPARQDWHTGIAEYTRFDASQLGNGSPIAPSVTDVQEALEVLARYVQGLGAEANPDTGVTRTQALGLIANWARSTATGADLLAAIDRAVGNSDWRS